MDSHARGVYIKTYGCQMNEYDSERLETLAAQRGFYPTDNEDDAGLVIVNTCSIREKAEQKLMGYLGRLHEMKRANPELMLVVSGCVAQQEGEALIKRAPYIDLVLGTDQVDHFHDYLAELESEPRRRKGKSATAWLPRKETYNPDTMPTGRKSFVSIMKGCDKICSYCIVPFTRGREKSRPMDEVVQEVRYLVGMGHREVTLIGQNVNSYGKDLGRLQFTELLYRVAEVEGVDVIRFTTSHPMDLADELVDAFRKIPKLASHFHLPVQSGSDRVLKEMRRDYTASWFLERLAALRDARPEIAVTTDIIVGFPTETEDDFAQTLTLLERARFDSAYSFAFSPRPHTRAAKMEDNVSKDVKLARLYQVQERLNHIGLEINQKWIGRRVRGYVEGISRNDEMKWTARMSQNKLVHFEADVTPPQPRTYVDVQLTEARPSHFQGTLATSLSLSQSYGATAIPAHLGVPL